MFALKSLRQIRSPRHMPLVLPLLLAILLSACSKPPQRSEDVRPVRAMVLKSANVTEQAEFSGEVRARIASHLGFRVGGKIVERKVDVGSVVKRGQVLMRLDPQDLQLSQAQAQAALRAAETSRDLARAELKRYQELREKNFVSQNVLDSKESADKSAQANVDSARAAYRGQTNLAGYSTLVADIDGVVTAVEAEAGQVVAAGAPVVRVAGAGQKEVVIGLPEDKVASLRAVSDVQVRLWAQPQVSAVGKIREIAPMADPATRTYIAKVSIPDSMTAAQLGMTAVVRFATRGADARLRLPLTALFHEQSATSVWVVEGGVVKLVPVTLDGAAGNDMLVASGVKDGQTVVTAGVNLLKPGQKVTILGDDPAAGAGQVASVADAGATVAAGAPR
ncbi:MAG: efflux RND transporter periplasmic adaptor subunit [Pseudomonadota bacterium]